MRSVRARMRECTLAAALASGDDDNVDDDNVGIAILLRA